MPKKKGVPPEKRNVRLIVRFTPRERQTIKTKAAASGVCDTDYVRATSLDTPLGRVPRGMTIDQKRAQQIAFLFSKWGEVLLKVHEAAELGEIPYESLIERLYLSYEQLHTAVIEMIEAAR